MKCKRIIFVLLFSLIIIFNCTGNTNIVAFADTNKNYFTVYENSIKGEVLFLKGSEINIGDEYLSHENKLYKISEVDENNKTAVAKFIRDEKLPIYNVVPKSNQKSASAVSNKRIGVYHTHNDESYFTPDGYDSVYGKGGIHDVGKALVLNLNKLGIETIYREDLHLPHNSGAYSRSQVTASAILDHGVDGIFDIHRDSTKRDYYLTKVNGEEMSSVRLVIGGSSANYEENKKFAYAIKSYADSAYPGLIKDIYTGKGNYNQQLSTHAMLFEFGCENIEKDLVIKSTENMAKVIDVVLYGSDGASELSLSDVSLIGDEGENSVITGLASSTGTDGTVNSNETLYVVLSIIGILVFTLTLILIFSKKARYKVARFFSEMFAGIFGKKKPE